MAKKSMINRETKRARLVEKHAQRRKQLKAAVVDASLSYEERQDAALQLQKQPRDSSPCRLRNRCRVTGRPRGFYRKFGLARNKLRDAAMKGDVPGLVKASW